MTRAAWTDIARALAGLRAKLLEHAERGHRREHLERLMGVDLAARAICRALKNRSRRFDGARFMRIVGTQSK